MHSAIMERVVRGTEARVSAARDMIVDNNGMIDSYNIGLSLRDGWIDIGRLFMPFCKTKRRTNKDGRMDGGGTTRSADMQ